MSVPSVCMSVPNVCMYHVTQVTYGNDDIIQGWIVDMAPLENKRRQSLIRGANTKYSILTSLKGPPYEIMEYPSKKKRSGTISKRPYDPNLMQAFQAAGLGRVDVSESATVTEYYNKVVNSDDDRVISINFGTHIRASDLRRLKDGKKLNDEIVNFYIQLVVQACSNDSLRIHAFNSFFYDRLTTADPESSGKLVPFNDSSDDESEHASGTGMSVFNTRRYCMYVGT